MCQILIPNGEYFINNLTKYNYYRLTANDSYIDDEIDGTVSNYKHNSPQLMSSVRLHLGVESHACVIVNNNKAWEQIQNILGNTKKGSKTFGNGTVLEKRGVLTVIGSGTGDQTQRP